MYLFQRITKTLIQTNTKRDQNRIQKTGTNTRISSAATNKHHPLAAQFAAPAASGIIISSGFPHVQFKPQIYLIIRLLF